MKKIISLLLALAALINLAGCTQLKQEYLNGLGVKDATVILGGQPPIQQITYRLILLNGGKQSIRVDSIRPIVSSVFADMMGKQDLNNKVGKDILPGEELAVSGKFQLKTNGIPKEQLDKMGKLVKSFQISSRETFAAPDLQTETASNLKAKKEAASVTKATPTAKP